MARIVTEEEAAQMEPGQLRDYAYNALDVVGTREVWDNLRLLLNPLTERTYAFERALQAPALTMMRRGILVDQERREIAKAALKRELGGVQRDLNALPWVKEKWDGRELETGFCKVPHEKTGKKRRHKWPRGLSDEDPAKRCELCGKGRWKRKAFNPGSPPQCTHLFHDLLALPAYQNKQHKVSIDEDTLGRYAENFPTYKPLIDLMLVYRGIKKQLGFLSARLSPRGRFHQSMNVGTAWTGRFSSSKSPFGEGGNIQNIAERHRSIFIADPGYELFYADLKTAESFVVAYMSGDDQYIEAHNSGDTHTYVARLLWPEHPWDPEGDISADKKWAKANSPDWDQAPGHDWRFQAKRVQHATNIGQSAYGMAMTAHISKNAALDARSRYFTAFPFIREYQNHVRGQVEGGEVLVNPLGRSARLFGRPKDDRTFKQGLAFYQQSPVADTINMAIWWLWKHYDPDLIQIIAQVHDAVLGQYPVGRREEALAALYDSMRIAIPIRDRIRGIERTLVIPVEVATGKNWGKKDEKNPFGIDE